MDERDGSRTVRRIPAEAWGARLEASAILVAAREEAAALVATAREEAARVREEACRMAEAHRAAAEDAGLAQGRARAAAGLLRAAAERDRVLRDCGDDLLSLAAELASAILRREVRPVEDAGASARTALESLRGEARVTVRASPGESAALSTRGGVLAALPGLEVLPDPGLDTGEVVVEAGGATVDGRHRAGLAELLRLVHEEGAA